MNYALECWNNAFENYDVIYEKLTRFLVYKIVINLQEITNPKINLEVCEILSEDVFSFLV